MAKRQQYQITFKIGWKKSVRTFMATDEEQALDRMLRKYPRAKIVSVVIVVNNA